MQKWEYLSITVDAAGCVTHVNRHQVLKKRAQGLLALDQLYTFDEYLAIIGNDGWEVVASIKDWIVAKRPAG